VSKNIYASFFLPFLSSLLNPGTVEKQLVTSLQATRSRGNIYTLLRFGYPQGWERAPGTGSFGLLALPELPAACGTRLCGSVAGKRSAPLCSLPAQSLLSLLCHPSRSAASLSDCTLQYVLLQYVLFNVKHQVQGFSSPYTRRRCLKAGVDLCLSIKGPNSAHSHSSEAGFNSRG